MQILRPHSDLPIGSSGGGAQQSVFQQAHQGILITLGLENRCVTKAPVSDARVQSCQRTQTARSFYSQGSLSNGKPCHSKILPGFVHRSLHVCIRLMLSAHRKQVSVYLSECKGPFQQRSQAPTLAFHPERHVLWSSAFST